MAATIINLRAIEDSINMVSRQIAEQQAALDDIERVINSMDGVWESESQKVYAEKFRMKKRKIENFNRTLNEYLRAMQSFAHRCSRVDNGAGSRLRNISW